MSLVILKNLVPSSKYSIKCPYTMNATRIIVHNTANDASAENEVAYMIRNDLKKSFHYAVDDKKIVQGIPEERNSWNAGDGTNGIGNRQGIAIEICYSKSGGTRFVNAEKMAVKLIVSILKRKGWGIDKVTKHQDYSGKYCPHRTLDMGWTRFINMVKAELNPPVPAPVRPFKEGIIVYPTMDIKLLSTAGYAGATEFLLKKGTPSKVMKYHDVHGTYVALGDKDGNYYPCAWTKEFNNLSLENPFMDEILKLQEDIKNITSAYNTLQEEFKLQKEELKRVEDQLATCSIDRNRYENDKNRAIQELNEYKNGRFVWIVDVLNKWFPDKSKQVNP